jgi:WD40 repeat protein
VLGYRLPQLSPLFTLRAHESQVMAMAVHPQQELVATACSSGQVTLWKRSNDQLERIADLQPVGGQKIRQLAFSHDGQHLLTLAERANGLRCWDLLAIRERFRELELDW